MCLPGLVLVVHVAGDTSTDSAGNGVMVRIMAGNPADDCAPDAAFG